MADCLRLRSLWQAAKRVEAVMKEIKARINCRENTCYKCDLVRDSHRPDITNGFLCLLFGKEIKIKGNSYVRLSECKAAE